MTAPANPVAEQVVFRSGDLQLKGLLWKPAGQGPFPAVLFNHGSAASYEKAFNAIGPVFAQRGYLLFTPYRRGHGLSADQGPYIGDLLAATLAREGVAARSALMMRLLETDHFQDQLAALAYLQGRDEVDTNRIAVAGVSFGGVQSVLAAARATGIKAAVDFAGAAMNWERSPLARERMLAEVAASRVPIFFVQAANDYSTAPTTELAARMREVGKAHRSRIYAAFGTTAAEGHGFGFFGAAIWGDDVFRFLDETLVADNLEA